MTLEQFKEKYVNKAVHCDTEEKTKEVLKLAHDFGWKWNGGKWNDGDDLIKKTNWQKCQEHTCYVFNSDKTTIFGSYKFYKLADYEIVEFESEEKKVKKTKKIFDLGLFVDSMRNQKISNEETMSSIQQWALKCHGLTKEEMLKIDCATVETWMKEVELKVELTSREIEVLKALKVLEFNWFARDDDGDLYAYKIKPLKEYNFWFNNGDINGVDSVKFVSGSFTFITGQDEEPTNIDELLKNA